MKILHTSDLHFEKKWFQWLDTQQPNFDVFCISGDFLSNDIDLSLSKQIDWISNWMRNFKKPLFVCSGNYDIEEFDNDDWLNKIDNVYSDNTIKIINNIKFGCIPYIGQNFIDFCDCDVILYHIPPKSTLTSISKDTLEDWGDSEIYKLLYKKILSPKIILCGHIHNPKDTIDKINSTTIYNCGSESEKEVPLHHIIEI